MDSIAMVALAALVGALVAAALGWLDSAEPFNARKFTASALRAVVAAIVFATGYTIAGTVTTIDLFFAFLGGAGVDTLGNRISGSIKAALKHG